MSVPTPVGRPRSPSGRNSLVVRAAGHWRLWLPAVLLGLVGVAVAQGIEHHFFMDLPMATYHVVSGFLQAAIVAVPVLLYIVWRRAAQREKEALAKLQASEALRDDMTHMLVHDLKGPLTAAMAGMRLVIDRSGDDLDETDTQMLSIALRGQDRLASMIETILEVARLEAGEAPLELRACDLAEIVEQAVGEAGPAAREAELELRDEVRAVPTVTADADKIRRVVDNLLGNALKYTPRGGTVQVSITATEEEALISVRDSGDGVPEHLRERIFDKFGQAQAAREGGRMSVGLGLAFCKLVVEAHDGRIWVEDASGGGSIFAFELPLSKGEGGGQ